VRQTAVSETFTNNPHRQTRFWLCALNQRSEDLRRDHIRSGALIGHDELRSPLWAPLRTPVFRMLWSAQLASNIGTWMQTVGAQWFLVSTSSSAVVVASVQTAATLPVLLLALPAGALADLVDRRRLLMVTQAGMAITAGLLAVATFADRLTPAGLLFATFCLGIGTAANAPAWQAVQPDVLPAQMIATGATLSGASINVARAVGPALGGVIVAETGAGWTFALNAASFLVVLVALARWRIHRTPRLSHERIGSAMRTGAVYALYSPTVRRLLLRTGLWMLPSSILFALLPVIAHVDLGLGATGYGVLLASVGVGALAGALIVAPLRHGISANRLVVAGSAVYSLVLFGVGAIRVLPVVLLLMMIGGAAWVAVLSTLNASAQILLPRWVRARGIGAYVLVQQGGQALGAAIWGAVADRTSGPIAFDVAGACLVLAMVPALWLRLAQPTTPVSGRPVEWLTPRIMGTIPSQGGPLRTVIEYTVQPSLVGEFLGLVPRLRAVRLRGGARRWRFTRDPLNPVTFRESYILTSVQDAHQYNSVRLSTDDHVLLDHLVACTDRAPVAKFEQVSLRRHIRGGTA
jgi:MFS family permease